MRSFRSHGDGSWSPEQFARLGRNVVFEDGVRVWHPEHIELGDNVYVGHDTMLKAYHQNRLIIRDDTWLGQGVFLHAAGGLVIGRRVGVGPHVKMITSTHRDLGPESPLLEGPLEFAPIEIEDDAHLGLGCILLPGVRVGKGAQVAAGAVVTHDVKPLAVVAGNPARFLRWRAS